MKTRKRRKTETERERKRSIEVVISMGRQTEAMTLNSFLFFAQHCCCCCCCYFSYTFFFSSVFVYANISMDDVVLVVARHAVEPSTISCLLWTCHRFGQEITVCVASKIVKLLFQFRKKKMENISFYFKYEIVWNDQFDSVTFLYKILLSNKLFWAIFLIVFHFQRIPFLLHCVFY